MKGFKVPIVLLGQQLDGYPCIFQDDYKAAVNLTEQMVKTGKKFGYITVTDKDEAVGRQRKSGVEKVLGENQITLESGCVKCGNFTLESGYEKAKELFYGASRCRYIDLCNRYHGSWSGKLAEGERISDSSTGSDCRNGRQFFWERP